MATGLNEDKLENIMVQPDKDASNGKPDAGLEGVIDELRSVLANLNKVENEPLKSPINENGFEYVMPREPSPEPAPPLEEKLPDPLFVEEPSPVVAPVSEPVPSDADFWNGNVLGWPASDEPVLSAPAFSESTLTEPFFPETLSVEEAPPQPRMEDSFPPMPPSPFAEDRGDLTPLQFSIPEPVKSFPHEDGYNVTLPPPSEPPLILPEGPTEDMLPVPKSIDAAVLVTNTVKSMTETKKVEGPVQIACIYPKGEEKRGQQFVASLRLSSEKLKSILTVQAVFIQAWEIGRVDVDAWIKTAHLAGADKLFILASKKDQVLFLNLNNVGADIGVECRLVLLEHIALRTLYADILVKLRRQANG